MRIITYSYFLSLTVRDRLQAQVQPITRPVLQIELSIVPDFRWDEKIHGTAETFLILVEDVDGEIVLFSDTFILRQRYAEDEHNVTITVPMFEPVPPNYYISDRWLHAETRLPISFKHLKSLRNRHPYSIYNICLFRPYITRNSKRSMRIRSKHSIRFRCRFSRPSTHRMRMFSLEHRLGVARPYVWSSLC